MTPPPPPGDHSEPEEIDFEEISFPSLDAPPLLTLPPLHAAGVKLAHRVLCWIGCLAVVLLVIIGYGEWRYMESEIARHESVTKMIEAAVKTGAATSSPDAARQLDLLLGRIVDARRASRDFWSGIINTILLTLFLPVLTAILGYIFGTTNNQPNTVKIPSSI